MKSTGLLGSTLLTAALSLGAFGAPNPVKVTSLDAEGKDAEFRQPVMEEPADAMEQVYQQQVLQQEVQELRGMVEQLAQQVKEMSQRQADRYQDVDRRIENLRLQVNEISSTPQASGARAGSTAPPPVAPAAATGQAEQAVYDSAIEMIRRNEWDGAVSRLQQVIEKYPNGDLAANSYYWLGEVYLVRVPPDYERARQAFVQVISFFPEHRKVPDAAFKLGTVYHLIGDCARATELLNQVIQKYPNTAVAKLAESYLKDKVKCD